MLFAGCRQRICALQDLVWLDRPCQPGGPSPQLARGWPAGSLLLAPDDDQFTLRLLLASVDDSLPRFTSISSPGYIGTGILGKIGG